MEHSLDFYTGWISGFFDGEGNASFRSPKNRKHGSFKYEVAMSNTDLHLIEMCQNALNALGIGNRCSAPYKTQGHKPIYRVNISKQADIRKFIALIPVFSPHKVAALQSMLQYFDRSSHKHKCPSLPSPELLTELYIEKQLTLEEIAKILGYGQGARYYIAGILDRYHIPRRANSENRRLAWKHRSRFLVTRDTLLKDDIVIPRSL